MPSIKFLFYYDFWLPNFTNKYINNFSKWNDYTIFHFATLH